MEKSKLVEYYSQIEKNAVLCRSCGMCAGVCPKNAIEMRMNEYSQYIPRLDEEKCIACGKCMTVCTARKSTSDKQTVIGSFRKICLIRAKDKDISEKSTSGGAVTALLKYGLENGYFSQVLTQSSENSPICAEPVIRTEITADHAGSKYVCAPLGAKYDSKAENCAATVLPCQAQSIRKIESSTFLFGLFCSKLSTPDLIKRMAGGRSLSDITKTAYREGTWPGCFIINYKDGSEHKQKLNRSEFGAVYNSYIYACQGCMLCNDYFAEYADISCGDPWGKTQYNEEYIGQTVVIIRSERALELVEEAEKAGVIEVEEYDLDSVIKGHLKEIYNKKTAIAQRLEYAKAKTDALEEYNTASFIDAPSSEILNRFSINNSFRLKEKGRYKKSFTQSNKALFVKRFTHAYLLKKYLSKNGHYDIYRSIAAKERSEV